MPNIILVSSSGENMVYNENDPKAISFLDNEFPKGIIAQKDIAFIQARAKYAWGSVDFEFLIFPDGTHQVKEVPKSSFLNIQNL